MIIKSAVKGNIICADAKICKSAFSKARGLMFSKSPIPLVFIFDEEKIIPLHMVFVFFPIDILFLDKNKKIVEIKESLMPFAFYTPKNKALVIIELPKGTVERTKTKVGDKINFDYK